jgi:hypothetical protein
MSKSFQTQASAIINSRTKKISADLKNEMISSLRNVGVWAKKNYQVNRLSRITTQMFNQYLFQCKHSTALKLEEKQFDILVKAIDVIDKQINYKENFHSKVINQTAKLKSQNKSMKVQSKKVLKKFLSTTSRHHRKKLLGRRGTESTGKIHSIATFNKYSQSLKLTGEWAKEKYQISKIKEITPEIAKAYLNYRVKNQIGQKQLNADRSALLFIVDELPRVQQNNEITIYSKQREHSSSTASRYYSQKQFEHIINNMKPKTKLSTEIAYHAGLRSHELLTLSKPDDQQKDQNRIWHPDRFHSRTGIIYLVTGKGGLIREVMLPSHLSIEIEKYRLERPKIAIDRGINYKQYYNIDGGKKWSEKFTRVSKKVIGYSAGSHGLRHSYAQNRLSELKSQAFDTDTAKKIISQEMGHWRKDIINAYLR